MIKHIIILLNAESIPYALPHFFAFAVDGLLLFAVEGLEVVFPLTCLATPGFLSPALTGLEPTLARVTDALTGLFVGVSFGSGLLG